jgi:hypothetical protein
MATSPKGLARPPFKGGLQKNALVAVRHDEAKWKFPYFIGLVRAAVPSWSDGAEISLSWLEEPKKTKVRRPMHHPQARMWHAATRCDTL